MGRLSPGVGQELRCRGWRQEGILRMLENTLHNAERPEDLVVYGGIGKAARDHASLDAIIAALHDLGDTETLVVQSGRPVAVMPTSLVAPRVLIANANLVPRAATREEFFRLSDAGLTMHGQYTAGSWAYIGGQGIVQGTFETFAAAAERAFGGDLRGRIVLTAGLGGMGQPQGRAVRMNGGVALIAELNRALVEQRRASGAVDEVFDDLDSAWRRAEELARAGTARVLAVTQNAADVAERLAGTGRIPAIATDQTSAHDLLNGYLPAALTFEEAGRLRLADPEAYLRRSEATVLRHVSALLSLQRQGSVVFEYGNDIRQAARRLGHEDADAIPGFVPEYIRPSFGVGRGPFRWVCLSGSIADRDRLDRAARSLFPDDARLNTWLDRAADETPIEGLPARICWLGHGQRRAMALEINRLVSTGELSGPVAITRDHLDSGSCAYPTRETEKMPDGSDVIADWPYLNAMLNVAGGADLVAIHQNAGIIGGSVSAGMTVVLDGTDVSDARARICFENDPAIGVVRHASAGVPEALAYLPGSGIRAIEVVA
ncbi:urocanate hydratase [Leucobacter allii]|uniref:urocanate hydratase n=1 Tax=Leucobacter allii TaxID=2932247 RepID=UPI001FD5499D|nr:urocanate hydratase [Leucobacter allii]UOR02169.1 urocanate hydratase [Leucobacter allii]